MLRLQHPNLRPLQPIQQPTRALRACATGLRFQSKLTADWTGTSPEDNAVNRARKGDTTNPEIDASRQAMQERAENEGIADRTMAQGTTQRQGSRYNQRAKQEHPKAPEPVIGMNDEKGQKGHQ